MNCQSIVTTCGCSEQAGYRLGPRCGLAMGHYLISSNAMILLGVLAYKEITTDELYGWIALGLAQGALVSYATSGSLSRRKFQIMTVGLMMASMGTIGALRGLQVLTPQQFAYGILGTAVAGIPVLVLFSYLDQRYALLGWLGMLD